ncbi:MAG TPA: arginine--tRNA ligase [Patescibacteria group bacterium]|nr:arginine--tRNA ligase [bacterium]HRT10977.1 arginine--tRNA ligase [Patescibacteria group bacterium]HRU89828.1 arginine--tRNA ligase [Patescibacteria group bacterium]
MGWYQEITKEITELINHELPEPLASPADLVIPPQRELGDLGWPCFAVAKKLGYLPGELAEKLVTQLSTKEHPAIGGWQAVGPYLNVTLRGEVLINKVIGEIESAGSQYGSINSGAGRKIMIEYSNVNTHKDYHIGHLRNLCLGDSLTRLFNFSGYKVIPVSYLNDLGIHVAKVLWKLNQIPENELPHKNLGHYLGELYTQAAQELANDPVGQELVSLILRRLEAREQPEYSRWQETRQWSLDYFQKIYEELDIHFDQTFFESDFIDEGRKLVQEMLAKGILEQNEGAILANLESEGLGVLLFLRRDGTTLYPVADLPLAQAKFRDYDIDESWYVIDERQSLYFKQLAAILAKLGFNKPIRHLSYGFVKLPTGLMSSREGNMVTYEALREALLTQELREVKERHPEWSKEQIQETAWQVVVGALKFEMVKVSPARPIVFDIPQALSFDGYTAAYIQYAAVRLASLERQAKLKGNGSSTLIARPNELEKALALTLTRFSEIVSQASQAMDPAIIAKYLFDLAQEFNNYYQKVRIIGSSEEMGRLRLGAAIRQVIINGLALLGIKAPEVM